MNKRYSVGVKVFFDFDLPKVTVSDTRQRRAGLGHVVEERNYQCWPPGVTVRVTESSDYPAGTMIAVCTHNLFVCPED